MAISTGTPTMKLNNLSFGEQKKKTGNAKAIVEEAWPDEDGIRNCNDIDYRPELTEKNINLHGPGTAKEVNEIIQTRYEQHKEKWEAKHNKKVRKDLNIAVAGIIKPDMESMGEMSEEDQIDYLKAHYEEVKATMEKHGFEMIAATLQLDEANPHVHYVVIDPEYKIGSKLKLKLFNELNKEVPKRLQARGYDVKILEGYDPEKAKNMTPDELEDYKIGFKSKRKKFGRNSTRYKKDKAEEEAEQIISEAEKQTEVFSKQLDEKVKALAESVGRELNEREEKVQAREDAVTASEASLDKREEELSEAEEKLTEGKTKLTEDKQELKVAREKLAEMEATAKELLKNAKVVDMEFIDYLKGGFQNNPQLVKAIDRAYKSYIETQQRAREAQEQLERQKEQERIRKEQAAQRRAAKIEQLQRNSDYLQKQNGTDYQLGD